MENGQPVEVEEAPLPFEVPRGSDNCSRGKCFLSCFT